MRFAALLLISVPFLGAETLPVVYKQTFWFDGKGTIEITDKGISFEAAEKKKLSRHWSWLDIQYFDRISRKEFNILTYEDQKKYLGRDRSYRFVITDGELTDKLFQEISRRLDRPVTNRVVGEPPKIVYEVPVKHLHSFGGCEGVLQFTDDRVYYVTDHQQDAREWLLARDVESAWSMDAYQFELHVHDNNRREFSRTRIYHFDLKRSLDDGFYRELKLKLYRLRSAHLPLSSGSAGSPGGE